MSEYRPAFVARKGNPGFGWVVDVLWPDGDTEVVKGFATEQQAAEWIAKHTGIIAVDYSKSLQNMMADGSYDWVNPAITPKGLPRMDCAGRPASGAGAFGTP